MKLDRPAGAGVRFEPGVAKSVRLVPIAGARVVRGQAGLVNGPLDARGRQATRRSRGPRPAAISEHEGHGMATLSRRAYAELYGPTKGDLVRLGDTELLAEIEHDYTVYGHELLIGAGKKLRDGEGINGYLQARPTRSSTSSSRTRRSSMRSPASSRPTSASATAASSASARPAIRTSCRASTRT